MTVREMLKTIPPDAAGCGVIPDSKGEDVNEIFQKLWAKSEHQNANPDTPVEVLFPDEESMLKFLDWIAGTKEFKDYANRKI